MDIIIKLKESDTMKNKTTLLSLFIIIMIFLYCISSNAQTGTVKDIDGNVYNTVSISSQIWMKENLKTIHYNNGDPIIDGTGKGDIESENGPKYYFNDNDSVKYSEVYGRLYTGYSITDR